MVALDVAYGELDWRLRHDPRVTVIERRNARALTPEELPYAPDLLVTDVSFISLTKVLPAVLLAWRRASTPRPGQAAVRGRARARRQGRGRARAGAAARALASVAAAGSTRRVGVGFASSGLPGPTGNRETFVWLPRPAPGAVATRGRGAEVEP